MTPHISQRSGAVDRCRPYGIQAAGVFDRKTYGVPRYHRGDIRAEESENRGLHCRFRKAEAGRRFGLTRAIGRSIEVPSRLKAAGETGMEVEQYVR